MWVHQNSVRYCLTKVHGYDSNAQTHRPCKSWMHCNSVSFSLWIICKRHKCKLKTQHSKRAGCFQLPTRQEPLFFHWFWVSRHILVQSEVAKCKPKNKPKQTKKHFFIIKASISSKLVMVRQFLHIVLFMTARKLSHSN